MTHNSPSPRPADHPHPAVTEDSDHVSGAESDLEESDAYVEPVASKKRKPVSESVTKQTKGKKYVISSLYSHIANNVLL